MSSLFTPILMGKMELKNRFIVSATYESMATKSGEVTDELIKRYMFLAKGETGLIIPGYMYVHPQGRAALKQIAIDRDECIDGLKNLVEAVHEQGGKIVFQLMHAGRQTTKSLIGRVPMAPSNGFIDPSYLVMPDEMTQDEIQLTIRAFADAARRAEQAGADGIQIHAANGYLINQFLSPFFNKRKDQWGGSDGKRFMYFKAVYEAIKEVLSKDMPILVKLNTNEHTPFSGITPELAKEYAARMADLGINGLELGSGTISFSHMNIWRGQIPVHSIMKSLPLWQKPFGWLMMKYMEGKYDLEEGYTLEAAKLIKPLMGNIPTYSVGGFRTVSFMERVIEDKIVDCISMSRPFVREPMLVKRIKNGSINKVSCTSCNECLGAVVNHLPIRCYYAG